MAERSQEPAVIRDATQEPQALDDEAKNSVELVVRAEVVIGDREHVLALRPTELGGDMPLAFENGCLFFDLEVGTMGTALPLVLEMSREQVRQDLEPIGVTFQERDDGAFANAELARVAKQMQQVARRFSFGKPT